MSCPTNVNFSKRNNPEDDPVSGQRSPSASVHTSVFDLFKVGIGPSSSHTVGPMRAAYRFLRRLSDNGLLPAVDRVQIELYGSLALTGMGHGTDRGVLLGLLGKQPHEVDPAEIQERLEAIQRTQRMSLGGLREIAFRPEDLVFHKDIVLPGHSNGMRFTAFDAGRRVLDTRIYYSVGGGFVTEEGQELEQPETRSAVYPFRTAADLLEIGQRDNLPIHLIVLANELSWRRIEEIRSGILEIWSVMSGSIDRGLKTSGELPGGLGVQRRAARLALHSRGKSATNFWSSIG